MMGALAIFTYVGAEVSIGSYLIGWLGDPFVTRLDLKIAGSLVTFYWGGAMIGRFLGTPLLAKYSPTQVLQYFALGAIALLLISIRTGGSISQKGSCLLNGHNFRFFMRQQLIQF